MSDLYRSTENVTTNTTDSATNPAATVEWACPTGYVDLRRPARFARLRRSRSMMWPRDGTDSTLLELQHDSQMLVGVAWGLSLRRNASCYCDAWPSSVSHTSESHILHLSAV